MSHLKLFSRCFVALSSSTSRSCPSSSSPSSFSSFRMFASSSKSVLEVRDFFSSLENEGVDFFCGVPDSLLKSFCAYVTDTADDSKHVITANEGTAIALASGYHMASGRLGCVYMQNSGLGNTVNPLLSLCDKEVYSLPVLLLIGWRGEPGVKDEPQHVAQGKMTTTLLEGIGCPYAILPTEISEARKVVAHACQQAMANSAPFALLVHKDTFADYKMQSDSQYFHEMTREDAIKIVLDGLSSDTVVVSTTGMSSREVFEHRVAQGSGHEKDFLTVGCMGHASSIAMGIALTKSNLQVVTLDGDGAAIMHLGTMPIVGQQSQNGRLRNFKHVIINNGAHDSVGGQPTAGFDVDLRGIALASGYKTVLDTVNTKRDLTDAVSNLLSSTGPALLEVHCRTGNRKDLGRPTTSPIQNKKSFMDFISSS